MNTGQIVKEILTDRGIKQKWLADRLGISEANLSQILKKDMKFANVVQICELTNIPVESISEALKKEKEMSLTTAKKSNSSHQTKLHK